MNELLKMAVGVLILVAFVSSLAAESFRAFSRSRLDEACRRQRRPDRFGVILRRSNEAFLTAELWRVLSIVALAVLGGVRLGADLDAAESPAAGWLALILEPLLLGAGFVLAFHAIPWSLSRVMGERFIARTWPLMQLLIQFASPYVGLTGRFDRFMHRVFGLKEPGERNAESLAREIKSVVDLGQREGFLASHARRMIERVIALQQDDVGAVMTPRTEMDCVPADSSLEEARRLMLAGGHSRMPVIGSSTDDVIGVLYAKDLLRHMAGGSNGHLQLKDVVREPFYVPETTSINKLLESMKRRRVHIAIVIDEYSGVSGLVTMEDILEQIVGDIVDEYDTTEDTGIRIVGAGSLEIGAWVRLDDLDEQFGFDFPEDQDYDTLGGFVYAQLGRIPRKRDVLAWKQLRLTVLEADKRRIHKIRLDALSPLPLRLAEQR